MKWILYLIENTSLFFKIKEWLMNKYLQKIFDLKWIRYYISKKKLYNLFFNMQKSWISNHGIIEFFWRLIDNYHKWNWSIMENKREKYYRYFFFISNLFFKISFLSKQNFMRIYITFDLCSFLIIRFWFE